MDSRLLNVFRDDPFDDTYVKYDNDTEFWTNESEVMSLQLTETLNGILPIEATEDGSDIYNSSMLKDDIQTVQIDATNSNVQVKNVLSHEGYAQMINDGSYNTITQNGDNNYGIANNFEFDDDIDNQSLCSDESFRSRTLSSSIGDYESHTSDYDDDDSYSYSSNINGNADFEKVPVEIDDEEFAKSLLEAENLLMDGNLNVPLDNFAGVKNRTISTNTIGSDADALGLQVDANTFDLADFITKDDFVVNSQKTVVQQAVQKVPILPVIATSSTESDSDSDVIVDVETVENDEVVLNPLLIASNILKNENEVQEYDVTYTDNVKVDPSWSPTQQKKHEIVTKETKPQTAHTNANQQRNIRVVPNKKQCDFLKGKFGGGRNKSATAQKNGKTVVKSKAPVALNKPIKEKESVSTSIGVGRGGKNLALLKHQQENDNNTASKNDITTPQAEKQTFVEDKMQAIKRKLNLEEYKTRRSGNTVSENLLKCYKIPKLTEDKTETKDQQNNIDKHKNVQISPTKHSEAVTSIVKTLKEQMNNKTPVDPITEAKNKVLRMQELKKAKQLKIIDSTVSAKVPRVTKILPLKELMKESHNTTHDADKVSPVLIKSHPDYEEIIIVSTSCNTDISIPPLNKKNTNLSRSLLKSNSLLYNISDTFQKVQASENIKITQNSLLLSIQNVVVKQTAPILISEVAADGSKNSKINDTNKIEQHGEDKIIMHLHKNRIRKSTCSMSTQTEPLLEFPLLPTPTKLVMKRKSRDRTSRNYRNRDDINSTASSDSSDSDHSVSSAYINRTHSSTSSVEQLRACDTAGGYSSRSSRRHRSSISSSYSESERTKYNCSKRLSSQKQRSRKTTRSTSSTSSEYSDRSDRSRSRSRSRSPVYNKRSRARRYSYKSKTNPAQPAVEERRIVYVGRIEADTTKEMLKRKFLPYGNIRQITIHYKETGMKYGFVTYERSEDAFTVIDNSTRDPIINMYDISFGGRRAFCRASYADLDNAGINTYQSVVFPRAPEPTKQEDSFEELLLKVKAKMNANKSSTNTNNNKI